MIVKVERYQKLKFTIALRESLLANKRENHKSFEQQKHTIC